MKPVLSFFLTCTVFITFAQSNPADAFRNYLRSLYPTCYELNGTGQWVIIPGCTAIAQEDSLDFQGVFPQTEMIGLVDLVYFTSLKYLNGSNNRISSIEAFPPALEKLILIGTWFDAPRIGANYPVLPATLRYLDCSYSLKSTLPELPASLTYLNCSFNKLWLLPTLPVALDTLLCNNQSDYEETGANLSALPALPSSLKYLDCSSNKLTYLPALPASLKYLNCRYQRERLGPETSSGTLTALPPLPESLEYLNCSSNKLNALPFLPASLQYLNCAGSRYGQVNGYYTGTNTGISVLPRLPQNLSVLNCSGSNLDCLPYLPPSLSSITLDRLRISCLPNAGTYTVLPAGAAIFTTIGNYTVNIIAPQYFNVNPASINYSFTTFDTSVYKLIALQPNTVIDSAYIQVIPSVARPGFTHSLIVKFENVGTSLVNAGIVVSFDGSRLNFLNATNPSVVLNGNQLSLNIANWHPRNPLQFVASFTVSSSVPIGDSIISYASITANTNISLDSSITIVTGSYDPNDKTATPKLTSTQVSSGTFIDYLVRFQNTGTDTAFNIVITDTLNSQLDASTFEVVAASHNAIITREGSNVSFEYLDIQMPDSNVNEPLSHGYINFRVKPLQSVLPGAIIPNKADIYFDYNAPVITNVANTNITIASPIPIGLLSFNAFKNGTDEVLLIWTTENENNVVHFELQKSTDGSYFIPIKKIDPQDGPFNRYTYYTRMTNDLEYYRLKITELGGDITFSNIARVKRSTTPDKIIVLNNPAHSQLHLLTNSIELRGAKAFLINATGQIVKRFSIEGGMQTINIGNIAPGVFVLKCAEEAKKIVIE